MKKLTLFIADDHAIVRDGLRLIIDTAKNLEVVGESGEGREALELIERLRPDIAILDISMPGMTGIDIARHLARYRPEIRLIILSMHHNDEYVEQLLQCGIRGYVLKESAANDLLKAVEEAVAGNIYLSPSINQKLIRRLASPGGGQRPATARNPFTDLTQREREILKMLAEGNSNIVIGNRLFLSDKTIKTHRMNIMKKLDLHTISDLVKYAIRNRIIEP